MAYYRLGDVESEAGHNDKAVEYFVRACELESENPRYHWLAGTAYLQQKDCDRAITFLRRSVELFPEQPLALYNLALALSLARKEHDALEELTKAVRIDEEYARGWYLKAQIEAYLGLVPDALASASRAAANGSALSDQESEGLRALIKNLSDDELSGAKEPSPQ
ncbi:tetratricopeptide repeat protein [Bradyrhizobium manausense]|uniref:tetratricopeptide repeat protein n=1 Tax=Bradyrhizobium manausense TaxID=989370 RepID=UPI001BAB9884|nr:tetratricopeptide repeat protein [Bradyrhizobium manausense]MBR0689905.1 tetratricopeptide repeat protein [Bradyrhizobium manausense]